MLRTVLMIVATVLVAGCGAAPRPAPATKPVAARKAPAKKKAAWLAPAADSAKRQPTGVSYADAAQISMAGRPVCVKVNQELPSFEKALSKCVRFFPNSEAVTAGRRLKRHLQRTHSGQPVVAFFRGMPQAVAHLADLPKAAKLTSPEPVEMPSQSWTYDWRSACEKVVGRIKHNLPVRKDGLPQPILRICYWSLLRAESGTVHVFAPALLGKDARDVWGAFVAVSTRGVFEDIGDSAAPEVYWVFSMSRQLWDHRLTTRKVVGLALAARLAKENPTLFKKVEVIDTANKAVKLVLKKDLFMTHREERRVRTRKVPGAAPQLLQPKKVLVKVPFNSFSLGKDATWRAAWLSVNMGLGQPEHAQKIFRELHGKARFCSALDVTRRFKLGSAFEQNARAALGERGCK
ncbi:MAG: hypothetical protein HOE53_00440 [Candidatus Magasanikbacteria bacterium]|nr:hypothetical protein [Candidatus Magasanikbacteria bacterium]